jgi:hypothetical protein
MARMRSLQILVLETLWLCLLPLIVAPGILAADRIAGWKIYYPDHVVTSRESSWEKAPSTDVQVVIVFYRRTYKVWNGDHWEIENFRHVFHSEDYYWQWGAASDPAVIPRNAKLKLGKWMKPDRKWEQLYNCAWEDRKW